MNQTDQMLMEQAVQPLLDWYCKNARILPWRQEPTPYRVWVSEIMLQQTRVSAVMPYFLRWMETLPTILDLAQAEEGLLLKLWEGLGYYNRVRNLQKAAKMIVQQYAGKMPSSYQELLTLPGIGEYTAGAISSIAFGKGEVAVDGNVLRVISRLLGSFHDIKLSKTKQMVQRILREVLPTGEAGTFNQALMELGATVCLPNGMPQCLLCPWAQLCRAHEVGNELMIPVKSPKKKRVIEEKTVYILLWENQVALHKRPERGLLAGLWELPMAEGYQDEEALQYQLKQWNIMPQNWKWSVTAKHIFTHKEWHMKGVLVYVQNNCRKFEWVTQKELLQQYALPSAFSAYQTIIMEHLK